MNMTLKSCTFLLSLSISDNMHAASCQIMYVMLRALQCATAQCSVPARILGGHDANLI